MAISLITWGTQEVLPVHDAIIHDVGVGASGILYGCGVTKSGNVLTVGTGYGLIKGRLFQISEATDVTVTLSSGATLYGMIYAKLDLSNTEEPITIEVSRTSTQRTLTQEDNANFIEGVYEICLATFRISTTDITNLTATFNPISYGALSDMYYEPGKEYTLDVRGAGYLTNSNTAITFSIPLNRLASKVTGATHVSSSLTIRQNGNYIVGSASAGASIAAFSSHTIAVKQNCLVVTVVYNAGIGGTNNAPVAVACTLTVRFT
jgi:hypothetical protein